MIHPCQMTEPVQSSFTDNVLYAVLSSSHPDFFICYLSMIHLVCFFAICGEQHSVFFIVLQLVATIRHHTRGLIELLTRIAAFLLLNLSYYSARSFSSFRRLLLLFQYALWNPFHNFSWRKCSYQDSKNRWPVQGPFVLPGYLTCPSKHWWSLLYTCLDLWTILLYWLPLRN